MTGAQTNGIKRKSLRHAPDPDDKDAPPAKKPKPQTAAKNASQTTVKTRSKRAAYDEDDDGFSFSRTRSKKAKAKAPAVTDETTTAPVVTAPVPAPETQPAQQPAPVQDESASTEPAPPPRKKPRKTLPTTPEHNAPRRRSKRLSGNSPAATAAPAPPEPKPQEQQKHTTPPPPATEESAAPQNGSPALDDGELTVQKKRGPAKIPLPFGETPVLRRNKEMRKLSAEKSRRSSSGMRGRRASSLIEAGSSREADYDLNVEDASEDRDCDFNDCNGIALQDQDSVFVQSKDEEEEHLLEDQADWSNSVATAVPHAQVETHEFYKHISQDLIEPKRMRQLLMWSGHRALPEKSSGGEKDAAETAAMHAARVIQEELLDEFGTRGELSYWFDREDTVPAVLVKKPNPRNTQNAEKLQQLEIELARLQEEKYAWDNLLSPPSPKPKDQPMDISPPAINPALLDPSQAETLQSLLSNMSLDPSQRIGAIAAGLEFKIDALADKANRIETYRVEAHRLADTVLGAAAGKLEDRERRRGKSVDVLDRLRGLSRVGRE